MSGSEHMLILAAAHSRRVRQALQRWALRYAGKLLAKLGPEHEASSRLLVMIGGTFRESSDGHTMSGYPRPRRPAAPVSLPRLYTRIVEGDRD